jgi:hypothetical protein
MKIAVNQRVPQSACAYIVEPVGKPTHKVRKRRAIRAPDRCSAIRYAVPLARDSGYSSIK